MKSYLIALALLFGALAGYGQQEAAPVIDLNMENVTYPYPVYFMPTTIQGEALKMAYMDVRPEQPNGKTILLLHGKNFSGIYWETTARALAGKGYRVVIPDQIGFGKSSKPQHLQYTFQLLARQTRAILDTLQITKAAVLGHSMGGMLATRFTLMYPGLVEKLILEDPLGLEDWKVTVPYQTVDDWYRSELKQNYAGIKKYQQENYYHGTWQPAYEKWTRLSAGWTASPDYPRIAWNSALTYDMIFTQPVIYELDRIKCPTLIITGLLDRTAVGKNLMPSDVQKRMGNYPEMGKQAARRIAGAKLVEIEHTGHLPHIESFDQFITPLTAFLAR